MHDVGRMLETHDVGGMMMEKHGVDGMLSDFIWRIVLESYITPSPFLISNVDNEPNIIVRPPKSV